MTSSPLPPKLPAGRFFYFGVNRAGDVFGFRSRLARDDEKGLSAVRKQDIGSIVPPVQRGRSMGWDVLVDGRTYWIPKRSNADAMRESRARAKKAGRQTITYTPSVQAANAIKANRNGRSLSATVDALILHAMALEAWIDGQKAQEGIREPASASATSEDEDW